MSTPSVICKLARSGSDCRFRTAQFFLRVDSGRPRGQFYKGQNSLVCCRVELQPRQVFPARLTAPSTFQ